MVKADFSCAFTRWTWKLGATRLLGQSSQVNVDFTCIGPRAGCRGEGNIWGLGEQAAAKAFRAPPALRCIHPPSLSLSLPTGPPFCPSSLCLNHFPGPPSCSWLHLVLHTQL